MGLGLVEGIPVHDRGWNKMVFQVLPNPTHSRTLWLPMVLVLLSGFTGGSSQAW